MDAATREIRFPGYRGEEIRGELYPAAGSGAAPSGGVVLVHEVFGLDGFTRAVAGRLVEAGWTVLAPDLYSREGRPGPAAPGEDAVATWSAEEIRAAVAGIPDRRAVGDLEGAAARLAEEPGVDGDALGVLGFCMGGLYAYLLGCHSRRIGAVVDFYGRIVYPELSAEKPSQPLELALNLDAPLLAFFGEADASIPGEHVELMERTLGQFAKPCEIVRVPGARHGFLNHLRDSFLAVEAEAAWNRTLDFLTENLPIERDSPGSP